MFSPMRPGLSDLPSKNRPTVSEALALQSFPPQPQLRVGGVATVSAGVRGARPAEACQRSADNLGGLGVRRCVRTRVLPVHPPGLSLLQACSCCHRPHYCLLPFPPRFQMRGLSPPLRVLRDASHPLSMLKVSVRTEERVIDIEIRMNKKKKDYLRTLVHT